jgi:hypothetical protein
MSDECKIDVDPGVIYGCKASRPVDLFEANIAQKCSLDENFKQAVKFKPLTLSNILQHSVCWTMLDRP